LGIHPRVFGISPSTPTFANHETLSFHVSAAYGDGDRSGGLIFQDPSSHDAVFVPCAFLNNKFQCSMSFSGSSGVSFAIISSPRSDGMILWNAVIPPHLSVFFVDSNLNTHETVKKEFSNDIELSLVQNLGNITGSVSFAVFASGVFQYDVIAFFSASLSSSVFVLRQSDPVDLSSVSSSGLGPTCLGASIVNSLGSFLVTVPSCSIPSISLYRWSLDSKSFQLLRSVNLQSLTNHLSLLPLKFLTVAANEYFCVSSTSTLFCFNSDFVLGNTNAGSGIFEIPGIKSLRGLNDVSHILVTSNDGLFAMSLSNSRFFKYSLSSYVSSNLIILSTESMTLLVDWSEATPAFSVYRILFDRATPQAQVSLEYRYNGSWNFSHIYQNSAHGQLVLARESGNDKFFRSVFFGLSSAQVFLA